MKTLALALTSLLAAGSLVRAEPEIKGSAAELTQYLNGVAHFVNLAGEAEVKVPADRAIISVKVVSENKSLQESSRANQELRSKMLRALGERGVPADRVQASKFSSTPKYGIFSEKAKSYRVENVVKISARDEKEFQAVAGLVDAWPELQYDSVEFENSDKEGLKAKALAEAIDKVTARKHIYEEKLGVKLTPKGFTENAVGPQSPIQRTGNYSASKSSIYVDSSAGAARDVAADGDLPSSFSELIYKSQVTIEYAVEVK
jgi:uncharacterized protein YggE